MAFGLIDAEINYQEDFSPRRLASIITTAQLIMVDLLCSQLSFILLYPLAPDSV
jgi:hypothetical protein